ncbi:putative membrane protein [Enterococcus sp. PF1-24]|uniref:ECF transporter S component n=1 Tax=unclassified Enterococcus TaxID=2608891 RepID=UPI002474C256|nr:MULTISPECIES: ECF transporter S component [unclassified Enterococcus]MDH6364208.1 putative membrane protein [Enterococcus sp. PFB1-1]MDH6401309.1 putative membrane protein [Enterococcus sp. PF1-24]
MVFVALFAALTTIATQIKIPLPTGAFVHLGNALVLLSVLLLGYRKGALAGGLGLAIFDMLNGYQLEAPYFILESFIVGGAAYLVIKAYHHEINSIPQLLSVAIAAGIAKIMMTFLKNFVVQFVIGDSLIGAITYSFTKLLATGINVTLTAIIVTLVYFPLKKALQPFLRDLK